MFRLGVVEESLESRDTLKILKPFFYSQRVEDVPGDTSLVWHTNEYHVPDDKIYGLLPILEQRIKPTWYIHAFNYENLIVILKGKSFTLSLYRDATWKEMITYGESVDGRGDILKISHCMYDRILSA